MGFWGIEVEPDKPYLYQVQRKLHLARATLGLGAWTESERSIIQCSIGLETRPTFLCSFSKNEKESCSMNIEFEVDDGLVAFSVVGNRSIHLSGYFVAIEDHGDVSKSSDAVVGSKRKFQNIDLGYPNRALDVKINSDRGESNGYEDKKKKKVQEVKGKTNKDQTVADMEAQIKSTLSSRVKCFHNRSSFEMLSMEKPDGKRACPGNEGRMKRPLVSVFESNRRVRSKICNNNNMGAIRSWDEMPRDILVTIIKQFRWVDWTRKISCVCRSWLFALVDVVIPRNNVIDLRELDLLRDSKSQGRFGAYSSYMNKFLYYLKIALDRRPTSAWTTLYFPNETHIKDNILHYIAERTPLLREFNVPKDFAFYMGFSHTRITQLIPYWKNLRAAHVDYSQLCALRDNCKFLCRLSIYGVVADHVAVMIANSFPLLKYLVIPSCTLSVDTLRIILDGHKNLELLDTRHSYCIDNVDILEKRYFPGNSKSKASWDEEVVNQMAAAAGVKLHLQCERKNCSQCGHLFTTRGVTSVSQRPW